MSGYRRSWHVLDSRVESGTIHVEEEDDEVISRFDSAKFPERKGGH